MKPFIRWFIAVSLLSSIAVSPALAAPSPEVAKGLAWLQAQVQADGALSGEGASVATPAQARAETLTALKFLATVPSQLADAIAADSEDNTEYLSRRIVALSLAARPVSALVAQVGARQNADGGFGGAAGSESGVMDTAYALMAYAVAGQGGSAPAQAARNFLAASVQTDGGMAGSTNAERIANSALALSALQSAPGTSSSLSAINVLTSWLLRVQGAEGSWLQDSTLSGLALLALSPVVTDTNLVSVARAYLTGLQGVDGSWFGDPFVTALALRALSSNAGTTSALQAAIIGTVLDQNAGASLSGASITVTGAGAGTATSGTDGRFQIGNLVGGSYTVQIQKTGYGTFSKNYTLAAGQTLDVGAVALAQLSNAGIVRGQVTAASNGAALPGVAVALSGSASLSAVTDGAGRFEFTGVPAGTIALSASLAGYNSASGAANLVAGQTLVFSPALYAAGDPNQPTTGQFVGKVVAAGVNTPLQGVTVLLNGAPAGSTAADGTFSIGLGAGGYAASFSLAGYDPANANFILTAGTVVNAGTIALNKQLTASSLRGRVADQATGNPLPGATVQVLNGLSATAGSDGSYVLENLPGTSFDIRVSAAGYLSQSWQLQLSRPTDVSQDFALTPQGGNTLELSGLIVTPGTAASRADIMMSATVTNTGSGPAAGVLSMQVVDAQNNVVSQGAAYEGTGTSFLGAFNLAPGESIPVVLKWNTGQFPPAGYALIARVSEAGTLTATSPLGNVLSARQGTILITGEQHFSGGVSADPPVLQAGLSTTVHLSAVVQNDGNTPLPALDYTLKAVDSKTGAVVLTQVVSGAAMNVGEFQTLNFADWVPTGSGDYALEVAATDPLLGKLAGKVYVGDAATAQFTLNKQVAPPGTQTVKGNIHVTGQDVTLGTISDPLVPLIKTAVQKGVTYGDQHSSNWVLTNRCLGCHIATQALVGGEMTTKITTYNVSQRNTIYNSIATHLQSNGALYASHPEYSRTQTMLGAWALTAWHKKAAIADTLDRVSGYLLGVQESSGRWTADHASGWWASPVANTAFNAKSLIDISKTLLVAPSGQVGNYAMTAWVGGNISLPFHIEPDSSGNLFVSNSNGTVAQVKMDGSTQVLMSGLNSPRGIAIGGDGSLYVATASGIVKRTSTGVVSTFSTQAAWGVAWGPDGNLYASDPSTNRLLRIPASGAASTWVSGGLLSTPQGVTFSSSGDLVVANWGNAKILRYRLDGTGEAVVSWTSGRPRDIVRQGDGWLVTADMESSNPDTGLYRYDHEWHGERLLFGAARAVAVRSDGQLVADNGSTVLNKVSHVATDVGARNAAIASAVSKAVNWLLVDGNINSGNNLDLAHRLIGLGAARAYYDGQPIVATIQSKIDSVGSLLKSRQRSDGGWGWTTSHGSDSMVTAQVGVALDYLNPSAKDPVIQNAVAYLLKRQQADGSWMSENGIVSTREAATTWVEIWLPVALDRLGGIDTDLTVAMPANVALSNPTPAPSSVAPNAAGGNTYVWKLQGVTSAGRDVGFDLGFTSLAVGESRPAASDAFMTFTNTFTKSPQTAPVKIPSLVASAFMELGVSTDAPSYPALSPVAIASLVKNIGLTANGGAVGLSIYSATDNVLVADLGSYPFSGLLPATQVSLPAVWNTGTTAPGSYYVLGTLLDNQGSKASTSKAAFTIVGTGAGQFGVGARIVTHKQSYQPYDLVKVLDRVSNLTQNQAIDGLTAMTAITKPDGTVLWTKSAPLAQLVAGTNQDLAYSVSLSNAMAGGYKASLTVLTGAGIQAAYAETMFNVASSAQYGSGLSGSIAALPKLVPLGDPALLDSIARNGGNADLIGVTLKTTIVDPVAQSVVAEWPEMVTLMQQQSHAISRSWTTKGSVGQIYVAVLTANVGGKTLTLAQDSFTLTEPPIKLDITQSVQRKGGVLVLVSCAPGDGAPTSATFKQACALDRAQYLDAYLNAIRIEHLIVTTDYDFRRAFRSGAYNVYWISGGNEKLENKLAEEVREAVYRGDSLILDGVHDERNSTLDEAAGVIYRGKLSATDQPITFIEPTLGPVGLTFNTRGRPLRYERSTGRAQATFATSPAIVSNAYGSGHALVFAFDWLDTLRSDSPKAWQGTVQTTLSYLLPEIPSTLPPLGYASVETVIRNLAKSVDVELKMQLPSEAHPVFTSPLANLDVNGNPTWMFSLPEVGEQRLTLGLQLPGLGGTHKIESAVHTIRSDQRTLYGNYSLSLVITPAEQIGADLLGSLQSLILSSTQEQQARNRAVKYVQEALSALSHHDPGAAIDSLLVAVGELRMITSRDVGVYRRDLDRMLQDAAIRWRMVSP